MSWLSNSQGVTVYISDNVKNIYGYTPEEIYIAKEDLWYGRIHADDQRQVRSKFSAFIENGTEYDVEYRIQKKDGTWIWIRDKALAIYEYKGANYAYGVFFDISTLKKREQFLQSIISHTQDGLMILDANGVVREWNPPMAESTEIRAQKAIGSSFWDVLSSLIPLKSHRSSYLKLIKSQYKEFMAGKSPCLSKPFEIQLNINNRPKVFRLSFFPIQIGECRLLGSFWRDINYQKQLENRLQKQFLRFGLEDQSVYLVNEVGPLISKEAFSDLLNNGYMGFVISRTTDMIQSSNYPDTCKFLWLADATLEEDLFRSRTLLDKIDAELASLSYHSVIWIDRLDYLISKYGFKEVLKFIYKLKEIAIISNFIFILSLDGSTITERELALLEKETNEIIRRNLATETHDLIDVMKFIHQQNLKGIYPSYKETTAELGITRPTARKRIKQLLCIGYLRENKHGRNKRLELTTRGLQHLLGSSSD